MSPAGECLFCKIAERKVLSAIVYESPEVLGFKDINPQAPFHVLFIPKRHVAGIHVIDSSNGRMIQDLVSAANHMSREYGVEESGYRLVINCRKDGGQTVDHLHLHFLAGRKMNWPPG